MRQKYYGMLYVYVCIISTSFVSTVDGHRRNSNHTTSIMKACSHGYKIEDGKCVKMKNESELKWKVAALTILGIFITSAVIVIAKFYRSRCKTLTHSITSPIYESLQRGYTRTSTNRGNSLHPSNPSNAQRQEHQHHLDAQNCQKMFTNNKSKCYKTQSNSKHSQDMLKDTGTSDSNIYEAIWGKDFRSDKTKDNLEYMEMKFTPKDNKGLGPNYKDNSQKEQFKEGIYEDPWNQSVKLAIPKCAADVSKIKRSKEVTYEDPWEQEFTLPTKRCKEYSSTSKKKTKQKDNQIYEEAWGKESLSSILSAKDESSKTSTIIHSRKITHGNSLKRKLLPRIVDKTIKTLPRDNVSMMPSKLDEVSNTRSLPFVCNEKDALKMQKIFINLQEEQVYEDPWEHKRVPFLTDEGQKDQTQEKKENSLRQLQPSIQKDVTSYSDGSPTRSLKTKMSYEELWTNKQISATQKNKATKVDTGKRNELLYGESLVSKKNHQDSIEKEKNEKKKKTTDTKSNKSILYDDHLKRKVLPPAKNKRSVEVENINKIYDQPWERTHFAKIQFNEDEISKVNVDSKLEKERTYEETWV